MKKMSTLHDLMLQEMRDLYHAENQLLKALPRMAKAAHSERLREALEHHLSETEQHVQRLERAFEMLDVPAKTKKCKGMEGIIEEGKETLAEDADPSVMDAAIIAAAQKSEHYEIASYGCVCTWAELLEQNDVADLLKETMEEEKNADETLTEIAESEINPEAMTEDHPA